MPTKYWNPRELLEYHGAPQRQALPKYEIFSRRNELKPARNPRIVASTRNEIEARIGNGHNSAAQLHSRQFSACCARYRPQGGFSATRSLDDAARKGTLRRCQERRRADVVHRPFGRYHLTSARPQLRIALPRHQGQRVAYDRPG